MGEFEGLFLNRVAIQAWKYPLKNSLQREAILNFLQRHKEDLNHLSRLKVLVLLNLTLKPEFRGNGLGVQALKQVIERPLPCYHWNVAFGWARSYDGKSDKKHLNRAAAKILAHYVKNLPNCISWTKKSTFFLCVPGEKQVTNVIEYLKRLPVD